jgi:vesicle-fusing ATPase
MSAAPRPVTLHAPPAPTLEFTVASTPQQHLVYTNHIYIAEDPANAPLLTKRKGQTDTYVTVNDKFVYVVRPHTGVAVGTVGLSSIQRETCQLGQGAQTRISYWEQPTDGRADLVTLKLELELIGSKRSNVVAAELAPVLVRNFVGQVFTTGQIFCCDYQGTALKFRVEFGEAGVPVSEQEKKLKKNQEKKGDLSESDDEETEEGAITKQVDRGVLNAQTHIDLTAVANKFLTFVPAEVKKPSMLNPKFKFSNMGIGGLDAEFGMIFRRSFASRLFPAETTRKLGIKHVKGMLLYGPPVSLQNCLLRACVVLCAPAHHSHCFSRRLSSGYRKDADRSSDR